jgi:hypothetical protein
MITHSHRRQAATQYLREKWNMKCAPGTLANYAVNGVGPVYRLVGRDAVYEESDLDNWAQSRISGPKRKSSGPIDAHAA